MADPAVVQAVPDVEAEVRRSRLHILHRGGRDCLPVVRGGIGGLGLAVGLGHGLQRRPEHRRDIGLGGAELVLSQPQQAVLVELIVGDTWPAVQLELPLGGAGDLLPREQLLIGGAPRQPAEGAAAAFPQGHRRGGALRRLAGGGAGGAQRQQGRRQDQCQ